MERGPQNSVLAPDGRRITREDLPAPTTTRWIARRKAEVVAAVHGDLISLDEACALYALTPEEFESWEEAYRRSGLAGLSIANLQGHRHVHH